MSKIVKIVSTGRFAVGNWITIGPQRSFVKKPVSEIKQMLEKYPDVKVVERTDSGKLLYLNLFNYNKNNDLEKTPVVGGTESDAGEAPSKDTPLPQAEPPVAPAANINSEKKPEVKNYNNQQQNNKHNNNSGKPNKGNKGQNDQKNEAPAKNVDPVITEPTAVIPDEV